MAYALRNRACTARSDAAAIAMIPVISMAQPGSFEEN